MKITEKYENFDELDMITNSVRCIDSDQESYVIDENTMKTEHYKLILPKEISASGIVVINGLKSDLNILVTEINKRKSFTQEDIDNTIFKGIYIDDMVQIIPSSKFNLNKLNSAFKDRGFEKATYYSSELPYDVPTAVFAFNTNNTAYKYVSVTDSITGHTSEIVIPELCDFTNTDTELCAKLPEANAYFFSTNLNVENVVELLKKEFPSPIKTNDKLVFSEYVLSHTYNKEVNKNIKETNRKIITNGENIDYWQTKLTSELKKLQSNNKQLDINKQLLRNMDINFSERISEITNLKFVKSFKVGLDKIEIELHPRFLEIELTRTTGKPHVFLYEGNIKFIYNYDKVKVSSNILEYTDIFHPHISSSGRVCFGDTNEKFYIDMISAFMEYRFSDAIFLLMSWFNTYNVEDRYNFAETLVNTFLENGLPVFDEYENRLNQNSDIVSELEIYQCNNLPILFEDMEFKK